MTTANAASVEPNNMYLTSQIYFSAQKGAEIELKKPSKVFAKLLRLIAPAQAKDMQLNQTVIATLQSLNSALLQIGIDNVIRLSIDSKDIYVDDAQEDDDLPKAMEALAKSTFANPYNEYNKIELSLEHEDENFKYIITIDVNKNFRSDQKPFKTSINAYFKDLAISAAKIEEKVTELSQDQNNFNQYVESKISHFETFLERVKGSMAKEFQTEPKIDPVKKWVNSHVPSNTKKIKFDKRHQYSDNYNDYYGMEGDLLYTYMWFNLFEGSSVEHNDFYSLDYNTGSTYHHEASSFETFDSSSSTLYDPTGTVADSTSSSGGFWDSFSFDSDSSGSDASCSSCSSCSSCGGCGS